MITRLGRLDQEGPAPGPENLWAGGKPTWHGQLGPNRPQFIFYDATGTDKRNASNAGLRYAS
eukprot:scaffold123776_cov40-Attheya_sp.AAC.1